MGHIFVPTLVYAVPLKLVVVVVGVWLRSEITCDVVLYGTLLLARYSSIPPVSCIVLIFCSYWEMYAVFYRYSRRLTGCDLVIVVDFELAPSAALPSIWHTYCPYSSRRTCRPLPGRYGVSWVCLKTNTCLRAHLYSSYQKDMKLAKYLRCCFVLILRLAWSN